MAKVETERRGGVTIVTINRPEVHNCFDGETADLMTAAIESFAADDDRRAMVVTGAGGRAFCSGADLKAPGSLVSVSAMPAHLTLIGRAAQTLVVHNDGAARVLGDGAAVVEVVAGPTANGKRTGDDAPPRRPTGAAVSTTMDAQGDRRP